MKNIATLAIIFLSLSLFSQDPWEIDNDQFVFSFDDTSQFHGIKIDTVSNPNNIWQIGAPEKTVFTSASSLPNVIVTDTINPYPVNDTSAFTLKFLAGSGFTWPHTVMLSGVYKVDSDSLTDFGKIEFSPNNGVTWIDLLTDTVYKNMGCYYWDTSKPVLTGTSTNWEYFNVLVAGFGSVFDIQHGDTIVYKFTFISDSIQTNRDGLMYDDLIFVDYAEGLEEIGYGLLKSECFPNPATDRLTISFDNKQNASFDVHIYDIRGRQVYTSKTNAETLSLSIASFNKGLYFYKLVSEADKVYTSGKFIKE